MWIEPVVPLSQRNGSLTSLVLMMGVSLVLIIHATENSSQAQECLDSKPEKVQKLLLWLLKGCSLGVKEEQFFFNMKHGWRSFPWQDFPSLLHRCYLIFATNKKLKLKKDPLLMTPMASFAFSHSALKNICTIGMLTVIYSLAQYVVQYVCRLYCKRDWHIN